jgi:hypothetical protein
MRAIVALALVGCVDAPPQSDVTSASTTAFANDKPAYDFFVGKGLTNFQAAGIVGNLDQESGVDPTIAQYGGGPGRGIAQWSVGGRWDTSNPNAVAYASSQGVSVWSLNLQLEFIWYELTTVGYGFAQLKATTNVTDATLVFMDKYEICGTCASSQRITYAQSVLNAYGAPPDWSAKYVSQSWPLAAQPAFAVKCGGSVAAKLVMKNSGGKSWDGNTKLGTTMARDRASIFAGSDWLASNRAAAIQGTVAPGSDGTFSFSFHGPTGADCVPGTYHEFFGIVQEGVHWFSDNGEGGPPDNQLEALIDLQPGDPVAPPPDMAEPPATNGGTTGSGGTSGGGGDDSARLTSYMPSATTPPAEERVPPGCSVGGGDGGVSALGLLFFAAMLARALRRRA